MNDVILLPLKDPLPCPAERMLSAPHQGTHHETLQTELLAELPPQSCLGRFAGFQPSAWSDPKPIPTLGGSNPEEKHLLVRGENDRSDRLTLDDQWPSSSRSTLCLPNEPAEVYARVARGCHGAAPAVRPRGRHRCHVPLLAVA